MVFLSPPHRLFAALIGIASIAATLALIYILQPVPGAGADGQRTYASVAYALLRYFTILTNFIVAFIMLGAAIRGYWKSFDLFTGATVWIVLVGVIYHFMLSAIHDPGGPVSTTTNYIHHYIVPAATFLLWLWVRPRDYIDRRAPFIWLIFPLAYTGYMIFRAEVMNDIYPYPFSDPTIVGWDGFIMSQCVLLVVFLVVGFVFRAVNNALHGRG